MTALIKRHWKQYLMEAAGLAGFVIGAGLITIFLEHPDLPVMNSRFRFDPLLRRIPLGLIMGAYIYAVTMLWGKKSGAHINPALTWAFFRLKKISFADSVIYTVAQFAGAIAGAQVLKYALGSYFSNPVINYGVTKPKAPHGVVSAFISEFLISLVLMEIILYISSYKKTEKNAAFIVGIVIALYLVFEIPYSGMSLNPARSFAGAFAAHKWDELWVYFIAPVLAMLFAAEIFLFAIKRNIFKKNDDYQELIYYPVEKKLIAIK